MDLSCECTLERCSTIQSALWFCFQLSSLFHLPTTAMIPFSSQALTASQLPRSQDVMSDWGGFPAASDQGIVLIVDDTPANLHVISQTLTDAGFETAIANSGERALKQIQLDPPDLILLDVMMPGIDGFETCRRIKAQAHLRDIPIIFMTALADVDSKVQGLELGAVDYITKPFQEREVLARVRAHVGLRRTTAQLAASEARLSSILNSLKDVVWSAYLAPLEFLYFNPVMEYIYGLPRELFLKDATQWLRMTHPDDRVILTKLLESHNPPEFLDFEYRIIRPDGEIRWLHCQAQIRCLGRQGGQGQPTPQQQQRLRVDGIIHDITGRKQAEYELTYAAQHDSLTHLANRAFFIASLEKLLEQPRKRRQDKFAILFIDLDRFKVVNDSLGHLCGDQLLIQVSKILRHSVRPTDLIARLGGDEFTILLRNIFDIREIVAISDRIQAELTQPIGLSGQSVFVTASIGIVQDSEKYSAADQLLRDADLAMYQAKGLGKACHQLFSEEMYDQAIAKMTLENELREAIDRQEFCLYYQPILHLASEQLTGFEALVRWQHPQRGFISPADFIPLAEETGLILPLGDYILHEACHQMSRWITQFPAAEVLSMSVNLSERQIQSSGFVDRLNDAVQNARIQPHHIKLEITESLLMENSNLTLKLFEQLKSIGFRLSLDDFGTGYSSLSYLHRFSINTLKIDRSFINVMTPGESSFEIVRTITSLARSLRMDVVAEGVETQEQAEYLRSLSCDMVQGYFFSRPLEKDDATQYLAQQQDLAQH